MTPRYRCSEPGQTGTARASQTTAVAILAGSAGRPRPHGPSPCPSRSRPAVRSRGRAAGSACPGRGPRDAPVQAFGAEPAVVDHVGGAAPHADHPAVLDGDVAAAAVAAQQRGALHPPVRVGVGGPVVQALVDPGGHTVALRCGVRGPQMTAMRSATMLLLFAGIGWFGVCISCLVMLPGSHRDDRVVSGPGVGVPAPRGSPRVLPGTGR